MSENESKLSQKVEPDARETNDGLKKEGEAAKEAAESWVKQIKESIIRVSRGITNSLSKAVSRTHEVSTATVSRTKSVVGRSWGELHNPVILLNFLLGSGALAGLIAGYVRYDTRYLKGKSDCAVLATAGGAVAIVAADALLSAKYYKKFSK